ncbi:HOOK3_3 [Blepharisma stoltei]|uniref:HOOK N-terminal domain-containing protein n=1 Tax=Blepharisma stoltei TaxID=1481888 RepID=A0AAU9JUT8_9CILI|nr:unnamed protein product [Blepharisma stoltei]
MTDLEQSLLVWLNRNSKTVKAKSLTDLSDGVLLYDLMSQVHPEIFIPSLINHDVRENFALRLGNLSKLKKCLEKYYTEVLDIPYTKLVEHIEISAIARSADIQNLISLIELVMGAILNCEAKETYISRILELNEAIQAELMVFIQRILNKLQDPKELSEDKSTSQLRQENRSLYLQLDELRNSLNEIVQIQTELIKERDEGLEKIKVLEDEVERKVNRRSQNADMSLMQLENQLNLKDGIIQDLKSQINEIKKDSLREASSLRDELDVAHEKIMQLTKVEATLEQYKKRLEDVNTYKKKIKDLEDEKEALEKSLNNYENEEFGAQDMKQALDYYKEQYQIEKERSASLSLSVEEKERTIKDLRKSKNDIDERKQRVENELKDLKQEVEVLKSGVETARSEDGFSLQRSIQLELEEQVKRLQAENKLLRGQSSNKSIIQEMNDQMDSVLISKKIVEENLANEKKNTKDIQNKYDSLEKDFNELSSKFSDLQQDLSDSHEANENLKYKIQQLEKEKANLEHVQADYDRIKGERDSHIQEMKNLFREKDEITQKLLESKEDIHKLETVIVQKETFLKAAEIDRERIENKLREAYESERIALSQLEVLKKNKGESEEQNIDKIKYLEFERDIMKLNSENTALKLTLREKDDTLKSLQKEKIRVETDLRESLTLREETLTSVHQEEIRNLSNMLNQKENEVLYLSKSKEEVVSAFNKELRLMSMVLYEAGMQMMQTNRTVKGDKSWINKKRTMKS